LEKKVTRVEDFDVFNVFPGLAVCVEKHTRRFGPDFRWLRVQLLRCSESVPANMTEGFYAQYRTEECIPELRGARAQIRRIKLQFCQSSNP